MGVTKALTKKKNVTTVLGVDCSTQSFAFCKVDKNGPIRWGEINFKGGSVFERLAYGQKAVAAFKQYLEADLVVFEGAIYVQNKKTVILLAYAFGAVISALINDGATVEEISPMEWQNAIGNKVLTKAEKDKIIAENPGKSAAWYKDTNRKFRKQRTMDWVKDTYGIDVESDNVSDAIALAHVAFNKYALTNDE